MWGIYFMKTWLTLTTCLQGCVLSPLLLRNRVPSHPYNSIFKSAYDTTLVELITRRPTDRRWTSWPTTCSCSNSKTKEDIELFQRSRVDPPASDKQRCSRECPSDSYKSTYTSWPSSKQPSSVEGLAETAAPEDPQEEKAVHWCPPSQRDLNSECL